MNKFYQMAFMAGYNSKEATAQQDGPAVAAVKAKTMKDTEYKSTDSTEAEKNKLLLRYPQKTNAQMDATQQQRANSGYNADAPKTAAYFRKQEEDKRSNDLVAGAPVWRAQRVALENARAQDTLSDPPVPQKPVEATAVKPAAQDAEKER